MTKVIIYILEMLFKLLEIFGPASKYHHKGQELPAPVVAHGAICVNAELDQSKMNAVQSQEYDEELVRAEAEARFDAILERSVYAEWGVHQERDPDVLNAQIARRLALNP